MAVRLLTSAEDLARYDAWIKQHPQGNLWQSLERKKYLEACGKEVKIYAMDSETTFAASALVVIDRTTFGLSTWEIPRGPVWDTEEAAHLLLNYLIDDAKKVGAVSLYYSPLKQLFTLHSSLFTSSRFVHAQATRILDLTLSDDDILAQMHQKGRYNIRVAQKNNVTVVQSRDIDAFYALLRSTCGRDGFTISPQAHYQQFLDHLDSSFLLLAKKDDQVIAVLIGVIWNNTGIYYYGASSYEHRALMAPYLLQWEAMKYCKEQGCTSYDLLGIAPSNAGADHPWHGISGFKEKFGGKVVLYPPEQEMVLRPGVKRLLEWKRKIVG